MKSIVKSPDHILLQTQNETSWNNTKVDPSSPNNDNQKPVKVSTPPPPSSSPSTFVPINVPQTVPISSSPAYSDISDEDSTAITNENDRHSSSSSTINLLATTNGKFDDNEHPLIPNPTWTPQMLLQQYGSFIQQQPNFIDKDR